MGGRVGGHTLRRVVSLCLASRMIVPIARMRPLHPSEQETVNTRPRQECSQAVPALDHMRRPSVKGQQLE